MDTRIAALALIFLLSGSAAFAQRPGCPRADAPMPHRPPGKPPSFVPSFTPPARIGDPMPTPPANPVMLPPMEVDMDGEEGHVAQALFIARGATHSAPGAAALAARAPIESTPLVQWKFIGYTPDPSPYVLTRVFQREGSTLVFEQRDNAAAGHVVVALSTNTTLGAQAATETRIHSPSGCVASNLSWLDGGMSFMLQIAGPMAAEAQSDTLRGIALALDKSRPR